MRPDVPWPPQIPSFDAGVFSKKHYFDNALSKDLLKLRYTPTDASLRATLSSMVDTGFVPHPARSML